METLTKEEIIKRLDELETKLTNWGVNLENQQDQNNDEYQSILIEFEQLTKQLKSSSNDRQ